MDSENKTVALTRIFDAPRERVWQAWTRSEQLAQWWSPEGFTVAHCELDVRVGGKMYIDMQGPDGTLYPSAGEYKEVVEPEKLVYTNTPLDAAGNALFEVRQTIIFEEADGRTTLHLTAEVLSATPAAVPYLAGMEPGLDQVLHKLVSVVTPA